jgi:hypothetical protein
MDTITPDVSLPTMDEDISPQDQVPSTGEFCCITGSDDAHHMYLDEKHMNGGVHTPQTKAPKWLPLKQDQVLAIKALWGYTGGAFQMQLSWQLCIAGSATVKSQHSIEGLLS